MAMEYYQQRASVAGTLLITEATIISPRAGGVANMPGIYSEDQIKAWRSITDAVHEKGSFIVCQLIALGRAADPTILKQDGYRHIGPSAVPIKDRPVPEEMTEAEIGYIINDFATAAQNAITAGFDAVEVHGANGYLVDQFFHDTSNLRSDNWGGSVTGRARFGLEVVKSIIHAIGAAKVGFRISPWNIWQSMEMDDPNPQFEYFVHQLSKLGIAYLHVIESRVLSNFDCEERGSILPFLETWAKTNPSPVLVAGGFNPENVADKLDDEYRNHNVAVVFGRHFLANPDLPFRLKNGISLEKYDRSTFYAREERRGYIDYPFSPEFVKQYKKGQAS
ncbi:hypothetical protein NQ176_g1337 [Zarea fungicola]|uniref:Uncharacterized protein n=1 Tax=Zarea fungicola TaxID=93591 RepID=A0ACC1NT62_9HYPO|nr:hypothetical protein NQ176_g1337 [Lecanicillium fungicola]